MWGTHSLPQTSSHLYTTGSIPHLWREPGGNKQLHMSPFHRSPPHSGSRSRSSSHPKAPDTRPRQPPGSLPPTWHQHWEHPGSVQRLPESYVAPRCQQAEDPGATCVAAGPLGKDGDPSCGCKGGPRVPKREARGMGVATSRVGTDGKDVGSTGVGEGRLVVLTPAGGPGAPEGGLCPGERAGRPASGSSRSILGGGCRGCRMADGASTAFGKAETQAKGLLREASGSRRRMDWGGG